MHWAASNINAVTVYAASGANVDQIFVDEAYQLGKKIADEGWIQVNGGGLGGLMGAATEGALSANGIVDCVILRMFVDGKVPNHFRHMHIRDSIPERKRGLYEKGDAFIALPGGLGTLDELAEVMCLRQLEFHHKPIVLLNTSGYYDDIKSFVQKGIRSKFIAKGVDNVIHFAESPTEAIQFLNTYEPLKLDKGAINSSEMNAIDQPDK